LLVPFDERTKLKGQIKLQIESLQEEKQRLINKVITVIDEEINKLKKENNININ